MSLFCYFNTTLITLKNSIKKSLYPNINSSITYHYISRMWINKNKNDLNIYILISLARIKLNQKHDNDRQYQLMDYPKLYQFQRYWQISISIAILEICILGGWKEWDGTWSMLMVGLTFAVIVCNAGAMHRDSYESRAAYCSVPTWYVSESLPIQEIRSY